MVCQKLFYVFLHEVRNTTPNSISLNPGYEMRELHGKIDYNISSKKQDGGLLYTETVKIKTDNAIVLRQISDGKLVLRVKDHTGRSFIIGSKQYPVMYTIKENPPVTEFIFTVSHP